MLKGKDLSNELSIEAVNTIVYFLNNNLTKEFKM